VNARRRLLALALLSLAGGCRALQGPPPEAFDPLGAGRLLVASRQVESPVFAESVVLVLERSGAGALGLIVNHPTPIPLAELFPEIEALAQGGGSAYLGGPVSVDTLRALIRSEREPEASLRVLRDVFVSSSEQTLLRSLAAPGAVARVRAYLGYAGWAPGQLEQEIERGDWYVGDADAASVFCEDPASLWPALVRRHESLRVRRHGAPVARASQGTPR
jgi:putative transcriptional regulator